MLNQDDCWALIDLVQKKLKKKKKFSVQWFGGEPLLACDLIEFLSQHFLSYCKQNQIQYDATIITNGSRLDDASLRILRKCGVESAQVTLDGDLSLHDRVRREPGSNGSFNQIMDNLRKASEYIQIRLRIHVAPYNLQSVYSLLGTLADRGMQDSIHEVYFAPLFGYKQGSEKLQYYTDEKRFLSAAEFAHHQVDLEEMARQVGFSIRDMLDVPYGICTALRRNTIVVDSKGGLTKCYKDVGDDEAAFRQLGRPHARTKTQNLTKWEGDTFARDAECKRCTFLPVCLGGCAKQWHNSTDKSTICTPLRYNYRERILRYFADYRPNREP
jgi:uncharacterized protein